MTFINTDGMAFIMLGPGTLEAFEAMAPVLELIRAD